MTKKNPSALLMGLQTGTITMEKSMEFPQKTKMDLPFDLAIPLLGLCPKTPEAAIQKNLCTAMFMAEQFPIVLEST